MRWFKTKDLRSSIYAMFSVTTRASHAEDAASMDQIREAMLALVSEDPGERAAGLARRIRYATDLQALWFMRGEVMQLLARDQGEAVAREKVDELSSLFSDLLPSGLRSRPSPLNSSYRNSRPPEDYRTSRPHSDES
ncbi:hypothetical protein H8N03_11315 [Ramlibacter sp. USB13]|uniref:Uncharacterized protein n=1 Tax=Ramlibacter cellulosilyticus TaxID=2764187 RepID=A0A923SB64_9BURK|nr:hypothetical protein [Ramlibacter cellulosilyticus]MBC5783535.1 hypothetical protein [Ramlibacter cellulosilyticus]